MLVVGNELDEASGPWLERLPSRSDDLEIDCGCAAWSDRVDFPCRSLSNTNLSFADARRFLARRDGMTDKPGHLQFLRCLDIERGIEPHLKLPLVIFVENTEKTLLEDGSSEGVGEDNNTIGKVGETLHFEKTNLVEAPGKHINDVTIVRGTFRQTFVELTKRFQTRNITIITGTPKHTLDARLKCLTLSLSMS